MPNWQLSTSRHLLIAESGKRSDSIWKIKIYIRWLFLLPESEGYISGYRRHTLCHNNYADRQDGLLKLSGPTRGAINQSTLATRRGRSPLCDRHNNPSLLLASTSSLHCLPPLEEWTGLPERSISRSWAQLRPPPSCRDDGDDERHAGKLNNMGTRREEFTNQQINGFISNLLNSGKAQTCLHTHNNCLIPQMAQREFLDRCSCKNFFVFIH